MKKTAQFLPSPKPSSVLQTQTRHPRQDHPKGDLKHQVLRWLLHYPFQRADDIAIGLDSGERTIARVLQSLTEQGLVDSVNPSINRGNRHGWYYLTTLGLHQVAALEGCVPVALARTWHADERHLLRLLPRFHQIVTLQNIVHSLVCSSP